MYTPMCEGRIDGWVTNNSSRGDYEGHSPVVSSVASTPKSGGNSVVLCMRYTKKLHFFQSIYFACASKKIAPTSKKKSETIIWGQKCLMQLMQLMHSKKHGVFAHAAAHAVAHAGLRPIVNRTLRYWVQNNNGSPQGH